MNSKPMEELRSRFRGEILTREDPGYDSARRVYNAMIDKRPRWIARCSDVADVIAAVQFAAGQDVPVSVRSGGHNGAGLGICDDGLAIDLAPLKERRVDLKARTVRVGGGCVWGEVDHATHVFGMAAPCGIISTTGVGGLTLGGGIGYLSRKYGLTIDNLLEADVVLADGRMVTASSKENPDLFWALRGGGGNFGIVTSFLFRLHPVDAVFAGPTFWPMEQSKDVLKAYQKFIAEAPEDVSGFFAYLVVPPAPMFPAELHGKKMCGIVWCYTGPMEKAEAALKPMRQFGKPAFDHVGPVPFPALNGIFDPIYPPGLQWYWKTDFYNALGDDAIAVALDHASRIPTGQSTIHLYSINGAVHRVKKDETAFGSRNSLFAGVIVGVDPDPANRDKIIDWTRQYWEALHPFSTGEAYVNFAMDEGQERVRSMYGENYDRLAKIKKKYDPTNFFRVNQNIRPAD